MIAGTAGPEIRMMLTAAGPAAVAMAAMVVVGPSTFKSTTGDDKLRRRARDEPLLGDR